MSLDVKKTNSTNNQTSNFELGIRANLSQFIVQLILVFFVGIIVGLERNEWPPSFYSSLLK